MDKIVKEFPPSYFALKDMVNKLNANYPFLSLEEYGKSFANKSLWALSVGNKNSSVLYAGAFHGQEWITELILLKFCERICEAMENNIELYGINIEKALFGQGIIIIPCANPDGVEIALKGSSGAGKFKGYVERISRGNYSNWNANARGVDINHNFNAGWEILRQMEREQGITGPAPKQYGGSKPESEIETDALVKFCRSYKIRHTLALHSQGEEIYWKYGDNTPDKSRIMAKILSNASGYQMASPEGLASHGGFKDWFIEEFKRPGFTIEVGKGKNPLPISQFSGIYRRVEEMLLLAAFM